MRSHLVTLILVSILAIAGLLHAPSVSSLASSHIVRPKWDGGNLLEIVLVPAGDDGGGSH